MLDLRKGIISLGNAHEVIWTSEKGIISLVNAREVILTLKKGVISLVTRKKQLASGKERRSIIANVRLMLILQPDLKRSYFGRTKGEVIPKRKATQKQIDYNSSANLFQPESRVKGKVELNHQGDVHIHIPSIKIVQSILESEPFHCRWTKFWRVSCWHSKKTELPHSSLASLNNV